MSDMSKVLIVGDLHISDRFSGRHKNYLDNCFKCLDMIEQSIKDNGITHLICLGDWIGIGQAEKNLRERKTLFRLLRYLNRWNHLLNGNLYSLRGNHDIGKGQTDLDLFLSIDMIKNVPELDIGSCRIHMFNYGEEDREINLDEDRYNIGCFHTNLLIEGLTTWYEGGEGRELSSLRNLKGISMAIAGHIHNPSLKMVSTSIDGEDISLFYPGCPTRPRYEKNIWDKVYGVILAIDDENTAVDTITYNLPPYEEVFNELVDEDMLVDVEDVAPFDVEELNDILGSLQNFNLNSGQDYVSQIKRAAGLDEVAAKIALQYLECVEAQFSN